MKEASQMGLLLKEAYSIQRLSKRNGVPPPRYLGYYWPALHSCNEYSLKIPSIHPTHPLSSIQHIFTEHPASDWHWEEQSENKESLTHMKPPFHLGKKRSRGATKRAFHQWAQPGGSIEKCTGTFFSPWTPYKTVGKQAKSLGKMAAKTPNFENKD